MSDSARKSIFCISTYEKGQPFLKEAARLGCDVTLLTVDSLAGADWPKDILKEFLTMPADLSPDQILKTVTWLARTRTIDRIVALDEFDLEAAALLREHMRLPGLGQSVTRFFRDKLAMRTQARQAGIAVPDFTPVLQHDRLAAFMRSTQGPWLLKPRTNASAIGIKPVSEPKDLWPMLATLGDEQSHYVLECFIAGQVFHCEGVTWTGRVLFAAPCQYGAPPIDTMHSGGIFSTRTLAPDSPEALGILKIHAALIPALHLQAGVTHSEFIQSAADGRFYFLETAARVGGAYIADTIELATGLNPWIEWARIEVAAARNTIYRLPPLRQDHAGAVISLARQEHPDLSPYTDPEIAYRLHKPHHAGVLLKSPSEPRIHELVDTYTQRFLTDFNAVLPAPDKPTA